MNVVFVVVEKTDYETGLPCRETFRLNLEKMGAEWEYADGTGRQVLALRSDLDYGWVDMALIKSE